MWTNYHSGLKEIVLEYLWRRKFCNLFLFLLYISHSENVPLSSEKLAPLSWKCRKLYPPFYKGGECHVTNSFKISSSYFLELLSLTSRLSREVLGRERLNNCQKKLCERKKLMGNSLRFFVEFKCMRPLIDISFQREKKEFFFFHVARNSCLCSCIFFTVCRKCLFLIVVSHKALVLYHMVTSLSLVV